MISMKLSHFPNKSCSYDHAVWDVLFLFLYMKSEDQMLVELEDLYSTQIYIILFLYDMI